MTPWWGEYIGRPFHPTEFSCWGLVREAWAEYLGVELPIYGEVSAKDLVAVVRAMKDFDKPEWVDVEGKTDLDVVLMRGCGSRRINHVGLVAGGEVLHVQEASHCVRIPKAHFSIAGRIVGYKRFM